MNQNRQAHLDGVDRDIQSSEDQAMTMTNNVAQLRIGREVRDAEEALNEALIRQSQLFTSIIAVRRDIGLGAFTAHEALLRITKSQHSLLTAGGDLARAHNNLSEVGTEIFGTGADSLCPPKTATVGNDSRLYAAA